MSCVYHYKILNVTLKKKTKVRDFYVNLRVCFFFVKMKG